MSQSEEVVLDDKGGELPCKFVNIPKVPTPEGEDGEELQNPGWDKCLRGFEVANILSVVALTCGQYGVMIWAAVIFSFGQGDSVNIVATASVALFFSIGRLNKKMVKTVHQNQGSLRATLKDDHQAEEIQRQERKVLKWGLNMTLWLVCSSTLVLKGSYLLNLFKDFQDPCFNNGTCCRDCIPDVTCFRTADGYYQECDVSQQIRCIHYKPDHGDSDWIYAPPTVLFIVMWLFIAPYYWFGGQGYGKRLEPIVNCTYLLASFITKSLFLIILWESRFCDTSSLETVIVYALLMVQLKSGPTKEVEENESGLLHTLLRFEMFITIGYVLFVNTYTWNEWYQTSFEHYFTPGVAIFIAFLELGYLLGYKYGVHCGKAAAPSTFFFLTLLCQVVMFGIALWASISISVADDRAVSIVAMFCYTEFLLNWKYLTWLIKGITPQEGPDDQPSVSEDSITPYHQPLVSRTSPVLIDTTRKNRRTIKLVLNISLWALFLPTFYLKLRYIRNSFGDFQNPCPNDPGHCCLCTDPTWCTLNTSSGYKQVCDPSHQIFCDEYAPNHKEENSSYVVSIFFFMVLMGTVITFWFSPENRVFTWFRSILTWSHQRVNDLAPGMIICYTVLIWSVKAFFFSTLWLTEPCNLQSILNFLLIYILVLNSLKNDLAHEVLVAEGGSKDYPFRDKDLKNLKLDYFDFILQWDVGLTVTLTTVLAILPELQVASRTIQAWRFFGGVLLMLMEILSFFALFIGKALCDRCHCCRPEMDMV